MTNSEYTFNPLDYGFATMPEAHAGEYWGPSCFIKITHRSEDAFWYTVCYKVVKGDDRDHRWTFRHGLFDPRKVERSGGSPWDSPSTTYKGCITSDDFAKSLLTHILGTTTNKGTLKYGPNRLIGIPDNGGEPHNLNEIVKELS